MAPIAVLPLTYERRVRYRLVEALLISAGAVRVADLRDAFELSTRRAERDLQDYAARWPGQIERDKETGLWLATDGFVPQVLLGSAREWLQVLRQHGFADSLSGAMGEATGLRVETLEAPAREFDIRVLRQATAAIRERRWLTVVYQSMSRPEPRQLKIAPHALVDVGRWHLRAWSEAHTDHRDFLLSRVRGVPQLGEFSRQSEDSDWDWQRQISLRIGPHPGLTAAQREVVEHDYGMIHGVLERSLRLALVPYELKRLGIGRGDVQRTPAEQQIVLLNHADLEALDRLASA